MKTQKINISFERYTDAEFENKAAHILASMKNNPAFTSPIPTLADVETALTKYSDDLVAAASLDRTAIAEKNKSRLQLELLLTQLGMYVMYIANGDVAILTSSGYTLSKMPEPQYITNPGNVSLGNGITSGELVASVKAVSGAKSYLYQVATEDPTEATQWESSYSTRCQFTFTGLIPGKRYWIRVGVTGRDEQTAYSPVASQYVQ